MSVEMLKIKCGILDADIKAAQADIMVHMPSTAAYFKPACKEAAEGGVAIIAPGRASKENKPFRAQFDAASEAWRKQESHQWASETSGRFRSIIIGRLRRPSFNLLFSPGLAAGKCALRAFCFGRSTRSYACNTASGGLMTGCAIRFRYGGLMMVCAIRFRYCGLIMGYIRRLFNLIPKTLYLIFKFQRIISSGYLARHPVNI